MPRTPDGHPALDVAGPDQQRFQAVLFGCLMSGDPYPHEWEHPTKPAMGSIRCYLNWIIPHRDSVEIHTNTACRVASRMLPLLHRDARISGIPGLRLVDFGKQRLRLHHLPTGARLDLVDADGCDNRRDMGRILSLETAWHHKDNTEALWSRRDLSREERAYDQHWVAAPCTPLRSSLLVRVAWLVWKFWPVWKAAPPAGSYERLFSTRGRSPHAAGEFLAATEARIPGASYQPRDEKEGLLTLGSAGIVLSRSAG
ncbi:hypothetical protein [Streptomyces roseochromogenus]|uniref:hypothetical protein n=1 Tax=Streptomyces roseochromogenus TaxID=285450 RepID=UPI00131A0BAF|nr:hypothetical protein [Streptomyces roseochromogenus]